MQQHKLRTVPRRVLNGPVMLVGPTDLPGASRCQHPGHSQGIFRTRPTASTPRGRGQRFLTDQLFPGRNRAPTTPTPLTLKPQRRKGQHPALQELRGWKEKRSSEPHVVYFTRRGLGFSYAQSSPALPREMKRAALGPPSGDSSFSRKALQDLGVGCPWGAPAWQPAPLAQPSRLTWDQRRSRARIAAGAPRSHGRGRSSLKTYFL